MRFRNSGNVRGFTLIELVIAMSISAFVIGALVSTVGQSERRHRGEQIITDVSQALRATLELMRQEIFQAGAHDFVARRVTSAIVGTPVAQSITLDDTTGFFVGQKIRLGMWNRMENVDVISIPTAGTVNAIVKKNHPVGTPVTEIGPFPTGVLSGSTANTLQLYGEIDDDENLVYVEYRYDSVAQTLTRSVTPVGATVQNAPSTLLTNVIANPGSTPVFQYVTQTRSGITFVGQVTVTLTVQGAQTDPQLGNTIARTASMTIVPRNVVSAFKLAGMTGTMRLQNQPPGLPIPTS